MRKYYKTLSKKTNKASLWIRIYKDTHTPTQQLENQRKNNNGYFMLLCVFAGKGGKAQFSHVYFDDIKFYYQKD